MRESQHHNQIFTLLRSTVTYAVYLQLFAEALGATFNHIGNQSTGQTVQASVRLVTVGRFTLITPPSSVIAIHLVKGLGQSSFRPFDRHGRAVDLYINTGGNRDGFSTNSRHFSAPPCLPNIGQYFTADHALCAPVCRSLRLSTWT